MKYVLGFLVAFFIAYTVIFCTMFYCLANLIWSFDYKGTVQIKNEMYDEVLSSPKDVIKGFWFISLYFGVGVLLFLYLMIIP